MYALNGVLKNMLLLEVTCISDICTVRLKYYTQNYIGPIPRQGVN